MSMRALILAIVVLVALAAGAGSAAADFRDGPVFENTAVNGRLDVGGVYVFRSPANANNTVLAMVVSPFAGNVTPTTFVKGARYDVAIDRTGDYVPDMILRTTFSAPSAVDGSQQLVTRCLPRPRCRRYVLARGRTDTNIPIPGGGLLRAGIQDNPVFFDQAAWDDLAFDGAGVFPRNIASSKNFYNSLGNALAIVVELPSLRLAPTNNVIAVWARTISGGQVDREARPFVNLAVIPPMPRNSTRQAERRNAFNAGKPHRDVADFAADMRSTFITFFGRTLADAGALTNLWLPDVLLFQVGNPNGFGTFIVDPGNHFPGTVLGNGRRIADDVYDIELNIFTNGGIPTDNVPNDNGAPVVAFPYMAAAHLPLTGPGTGPNP